MNLKCLWPWLLMLVAGVAPAAPPSRQAVTYDPNDPQQKRAIIPREERESLGLKPHTWSGVVDPEVHSTLDRLKETVATMKQRLSKGRDSEAFDTLFRRIRFKDMVYVQVQLKDREAQRRVLASLKASEFHNVYFFENSAGLTGYVSQDGLEKLAKNQEVAGVCLDDKPLPGNSKMIVKDSLPPPATGEAANEPGVVGGRVDPDVYRALALSDRVHVIVSLRADSLPELTDRPSEMLARALLLDQAEKLLQDQVLTTLSADEFWLQGRLGPGIAGVITREGLQKLVKHPDTQRVQLEELARIPEHNLQPK